MWRIGLILYCIFTLLLSLGASAQGVHVLEKRNGFKDIKLMTPVTDYEGLEFKKDVTDMVFPEATQYGPKKGFYEKIGELKIFNLEAEAYKNSIYQIAVITEKDPKLYKSLKKNFGEPKYDLRKDRYYWTSASLTLSYRSYSKNKIEMIYRSRLMKGKLKDDKKKEIEEMANDF